MPVPVVDAGVVRVTLRRPFVGVHAGGGSPGGLSPRRVPVDWLPGLCNASNVARFAQDPEGDMTMLERQTVLVTGCSSGIGLALAREFKTRGHRVFATARRAETLEGLRGDGIDTLALDVTRPESVAAAVAAVAEKAGRLDIVVNNAGYLLVGPLAEVPLEDFRREFETNVTGALTVIQAAVPHMAKARHGRIVNIGSVSGEFPTPFAGAYCASKSALHTVTQVLRMELAPLGIAAILVEPGSIRSDIGKNAAPAAGRYRSPQSLYRSVSRQIEARAGASQRRPIPAGAFARKLVTAVTRDRPPRTVRIGWEAWALPVVKAAFTANAVDRQLSRAFGLDRLAP